MTVAEALDLYQAARAPAWKPSTRRAVGSYCRCRIVPALGALDIGAVRRADIEEWMAGLAGKPTLANRCAAILSGMFGWAESRELRAEGSNPCSGTRRYRDRRRERYLSDAEYRRLWRALDALESHKPLAVACIRLIALTGARQSEIRCLRRDEIRGGALHLADSKTGPRTIWTCPRAREILAAIPAGGDWVFGRPDGAGPRSYDWIYGSFLRVAERAGLDDLRLHDLRHSYASLALRSGEAVPVIGRLLGHRSSDTTMRYTHWHDAQALTAVQSIGRALA